MVYERWREWSLMSLCLLSTGEPEICKETQLNKSWLKKADKLRELQERVFGFFNKDYWIYTEV